MIFIGPDEFRFREISRSIYDDNVLHIRNSLYSLLQTLYFNTIHSCIHRALPLAKDVRSVYIIMFISKPV